MDIYEKLSETNMELCESNAQLAYTHTYTHTVTLTHTETLTLKRAF